jgi:site-specific recombinase XerD
MKLSTVVDEYLAYKRSLGMRFFSEGFLLRAFCRNVGDVSIERVSPERVLAFLGGSIPPTSTWGRKHRALSGLYRYALARSYTHDCPLPREVPKFSQSFVPYIYSREELKRLLDATPFACGRRTQFEGYVLRALLLLLYGAGLRISEALALTMTDVNLDQALLCIRQTKFYKTRLVPLGKDLNHALVEFVLRRDQNHASAPDEPFFCFRDGRPLNTPVVESAFRRLRTHAHVLRQDGACYHLNPAHFGNT